MNGQLELRIITQPYSAVYWGYFRRLVFGNSLTKHIKLSSFSYSVVIFFLPISHIPPCVHANPPDFPRLIGPRAYVSLLCRSTEIVRHKKECIVCKRVLTAWLVNLCGHVEPFFHCRLYIATEVSVMNHSLNNCYFKSLFLFCVVLPITYRL